MVTNDLTGMGVKKDTVALYNASGRIVAIDLNQFKTHVAFAEAEIIYPNARPTQPLYSRLLNMVNNQVLFEGVSLTNENFSIAPKS